MDTSSLGYLVLPMPEVVFEIWNHRFEQGFAASLHGICCIQRNLSCFAGGATIASHMGLVILALSWQVEPRCLRALPFLFAAW